MKLLRLQYTTASSSLQTLPWDGSIIPRTSDQGVYETSRVSRVGSGRVGSDRVIEKALKKKDIFCENIEVQPDERTRLRHTRFFWRSTHCYDRGITFHLKWFLSDGTP